MEAILTIAYIRHLRDGFGEINTYNLGGWEPVITSIFISNRLSDRPVDQLGCEAGNTYNLGCG